MNAKGQASAFRRYRVIGKTQESEVIASFEIVPTDGSLPAPFEPGQFMTIRVDPDDDDAGTRHYSLSGDPTSLSAYRITVKREAAPPSRPDLPTGLMSNRLHDAIKVGDELMARGPEGSFILDRASKRPVVLLSGGVGLTPLVAMAHALAAEGKRQTWFIHACESARVHAFGPEMRALKACSPNIHVHVLYRHVTAQDRQGTDHDGEGLVTRAVLQALLPLDDYDFYLCGPTPFMEAVYDLLHDLGVADARIRYEFFGPAKALKGSKTGSAFAEPKTRAPTTPGPRAATSKPPSSYEPAPEAPPVGATVLFQKTGLSVPWSHDFNNLLEFAEAQGLSPSFSCRAGICNTCACTLIAGEVVYGVEPLDIPPPGTALLCCARPRGDIMLAL